MFRRLAVYVCACVLLLAGARTSAAASDIVLYSSDVTASHGNWGTASDSSAAGGQYLSSTDYGWSNTSAPYASPNDYFEVTFSAPSWTPYHVWLRVRASSNSKYNDSVFAQFSDSIDSNGNALYRIGTTSGIAENLERCSGCGDSGWGWVDGAYWLGQQSVLQFANSGSHTLRIQTREDGAQIDQIVLSPSTYLSSAPGQAYNDSTIVPKPGIVSTASTGSSTLAYGGSAVSLPGTIQAAKFDTGGSGVSYYDTTGGNSGGQFRQTDVDIEASSEGGYDIGWTAGGEWLNYTVNVASAGGYTAQLRVASPYGGGALHIGFNGPSNVWQSVSIPATGGWQSWTTVSVPVTLNAGTQQMTLLVDSPGFNISYVNVTNGSTSISSGGSAPAAPSSPNVATGTVGVTVNPSLSWAQSSGATSYDVRMDTSNPPSTTVLSNSGNWWFAPSTLSGGTTYYWQVTAKNSSGSTAGPVWSFTTAGSSTTCCSGSSSGSQVSVATWNVQIGDSSSWHAQMAMDYLMSMSPRPQIIVIEEAHKSQYNTYISELQSQTGQTWQGVMQTHCPPNAWNGSYCTGSEDEGVAVFTSLGVNGSSVGYLPYADAYHSARAYVRLAVNVNGVNTQVFGTHLQTYATARNQSMSLLKSIASNYSTPQLLAGDFNADMDQIDTTSGMAPNFVDSWQQVGSGNGYTCSTPSPTMKLDYWLADASGKARPNWTVVVTSPGTFSDHFPVLTYYTVNP